MKVKFFVYYGLVGVNMSFKVNDCHKNTFRKVEPSTIYTLKPCLENKLE